MILGYEACTACSWKNLIWANDPKPMLIANFQRCGGYICPACRAETGTSMGLAAIPVGALFDPHELVEVEKKMSAFANGGIDASTMQEPEHVCPMTLRRHLRALVRWCSPWEEDTFALLLVIAFLWTCVIAVSLLLGATEVAKGVASLAWVIFQVLVAWRLLLSLLFIGLSFTEGRIKAFKSWRILWRDLAAEPLHLRPRRT